MNCQSCRNEIEELELGESLSNEASTHVGTCRPCDAFYHERSSLRRLVGSLEPVSAPPDFEFRLRARLGASGNNNGNHRPSFWRSFVTSTPAIGFAAAFALLVVGFVLYNQFKSAPVAKNRSGEDARRDSRQKSETPEVISSSTTLDPNGSTVISNSGNQQKQQPTIPAVTSPANTRLAANKSGNVRRQSRQVDPDSAQVFSNDIAARGAPQITPDNGSQLLGESNHYVDLPVRSSAKPVRVFVGDQSGGKRAVTLEPVIFGSQDLTGRNDSHKGSSQGIW